MGERDLWRERFDLQRFAGGDDAGGDGAADADANEQPEQKEELVPRSELERLRQENEQLRQRLDQITQRFMDPEFLAKLRGEATPQPRAAEAQAEEEVEEEEPDWESLTPKQFAKRITDEVMKRISKQLQSRIDEVATRADVLRARQELAEAAARYPDFWQYRDLMVQVANEYYARYGRDISAEDAYFIAKGRATAQRVGATTVQGGSATVQPKPKPRVASGEKPGVAPSAVSKGQLSGREAIEEAWKRSGLDKILGP